MDQGAPSPVHFLLLAVFSIALGLLVAFKGRRGPVRNYFSLFTVCVALWLASGFLLYSNVDPLRDLLWAKIAFAAAAITILSLYHVLMLFPDLKSSPYGGAVNTVGVALAVIAVTSPLLVREVTSSGVFKLHVVYGPLVMPFTAYALTVLTLGVHALVKRLHSSSGLRKVQIQYLLIGTVVPVAGVVVTNLILPLVFGVSDAAPYGRLLALVFLPLTAHAIIRHRLMNIRLVVQKAVVYASAIVASAVLFGGLLWLAGLVMSGPLERSAMTTSIAVALVIAAFFHPVKTVLENALNRYVYRERLDYPKILRESSQRLSVSPDPDALASYLTELVLRIFKAELVATYLHDQSRESLIPFAVRGHEGSDALEPIVPSTSRLCSYFRPDRPLFVSDESLGNSEDVSAEAARDELRKAGGELAVSFWHLERLLGLLIVGAKRSGDPFFAEDIDFLLTLGNQASIAIENLHLHRQMEDERLRAERLAVVGTLASGIVHEIKNPLVAIRTFAELLPERSRDDEFQGEFSRVVISEVERINGLVTRLRGLASGPGQQQLRPLDLRRPIDETLVLLRGQLEQKQIQAGTEYGTETPSVLGDADLLKQFFLNLFLNAIEVMEPGGELRIRLWTRGTRGSRSVVAEVMDSGPGIPDDILTKIFDPFFSTKQGGSGLGLAICRSIADIHHASIVAKNDPSRRGATFSIEFPVVNSMPAEPAGGNVEHAGTLHRQS